MNLKPLENHLPDGAWIYVKEWLMGSNVVIILKDSRKSKLGDYRYLFESDSHQITVNKELPREAFFFVLTHEIAHLQARRAFSKRIKPHGSEWKMVFGKLLMESLPVYNIDLRPHIIRHSKSPKANLTADPQLWKYLFRKNSDSEVSIESLVSNQKFRLGNRFFQKEEKRKIRYICKEITTGKRYLIHGQAIVDEIIKE